MILEMVPKQRSMIIPDFNETIADLFIYHKRVKQKKIIRNSMIKSNQLEKRCRKRK